jgi:pimeloyl-ACP methyl ester carboxylesterase
LRIAAPAAIVPFLAAVGVWLATTIALNHNRRTVIPAPARGIENSRFAASDGVALEGWWWPSRDRGRAVILLHGLYADRLQMFSRAKWLHCLGYSVLLFDFRGCGKSGGTTSFGFRERLDVEAALQFVREKKRVTGSVLLGQSMGAAAALMASASWGSEVRGAILESPFDRFESAVRIRVRNVVGSLEPAVSPLLLAQVPFRLGFHPEDLAPVEAIRKAHGPVLLGFGGRDPYLGPGQVAGLFREAPYPATLWVAQKAGHTDLFRFDPETYRAKIGGFIAAALGPPDRGGQE